MSNFENPRIIDCNGQKYRIGWTDYGWFDFQAVVEDPETGGYISDPSVNHTFGFPADEKNTVLEAIEDQ